jgi:hypothetical protein
MERRMRNGYAGIAVFGGVLVFCVFLLSLVVQ